VEINLRVDCLQMHFLARRRRQTDRQAAASFSGQQQQQHQHQQHQQHQQQQQRSLDQFQRSGSGSSFSSFPFSNVLERNTMIKNVKFQAQQPKQYISEQRHRNIAILERFPVQQLPFEHSSARQMNDSTSHTWYNV
jgi:hypothetical protein